MKNKILPYVILFVALGLSSTAAYYSIIGLSKLFAGVALAVIIMSSFLEASKLVIASLLYQYWNTLNKILRTYLTIALLTLILITSMGIYGMLSSGYQDTYRQLTIKENQTKFLTQKKDFYEKDVIRYDTELERISSNISTLSNAKSSSIQIKDTSVVGGLRTTISTAELRLAQKRIEVEEKNRAKIQSKREVVADSLQKYQLQILELDNNTEVAGELGPLQYLSGLTGVSMDKIINILLLIIIFVFDPLAISLVIASNFAFEKAFPKKPIVKEDKNKEWEEAERRMEIVGQNGNDGLHYESEEEKLKQYEIYGEIESEDPIDFDDETPPTPQSPLDTQISELKKYLEKEKIGGINSRLKKDLENQIKYFEQQRENDDDLTKTY